MKFRDVLIIFLLLTSLLGSYKILSHESFYDCMDNSCCSLRTIRSGDLNLFSSIGNIGLKTSDLLEYLFYGISESCEHFMMSCNLIDPSDIRMRSDKLSVFKTEFLTQSSGMNCPPFNLRNTDGEFYSLDLLKGRKVALMFIDLRYSNSIDHLLNVNELKRAFDEKDIRIIPACLNYDAEEAINHPETLTNKLNLSFPLTTLENPDELDRLNPDKRSITLLITENGLVANILDGSTDLAFLQASIRQFIQ